MWEHVVGRYSTPVKNEIEKGAIKKFSLAIDEPLPIYIDEQFASQSPHGKIVAPPTFPRTLDFGEIEGLDLPPAGLIHGEQTYKYRRPLYAGDIVYCQSELLSVKKKEGRAGQLIFIELRQAGFLDPLGFARMEKEIFTSIRTLIVTGNVIRGVTNG